MVTYRKLGENQISMLESLHRHKLWHAGCGWIWDNPSGTVRILESLKRRGLVRHTEVEFPTLTPGYKRTRVVWALSPAGKALFCEHGRFGNGCRICKSRDELEASRDGADPWRDQC